jgi:hypothetical protein
VKFSISEYRETCREALARIAAKYPQLCINGSKDSWTHARRTHGAHLLTSGAAFRLPSGVWLAHDSLFEPAMVALISGQEIPSAPKRERAPHGRRQVAAAR